MKRFGILCAAIAASAVVYVASSFHVPAFAEQVIFSSQAAADALREPLSAAVVFRAVVTILAALIVLVIVRHAFLTRRSANAARSVTLDAADLREPGYTLDAGIPRIRDPSPSG